MQRPHKEDYNLNTVKGLRGYKDDLRRYNEYLTKVRNGKRKRL